jgi:hypothetical protein
MQSLDAWRKTPIARDHDRPAFDCGVADLNAYLQRYARQNHESGGAKSFVAMTGAHPTRILQWHPHAVRNYLAAIRRFNGIR